MCVFNYSDGTSKTREGLPRMCLDACCYADSQLEEVVRQLQQGDITVTDLEKINGHIEQMNRLCTAAQKIKCEVEHTLGYVHVRQLVEMRLEEFATYQEQLGYLQHLCSKIHPRIDGEGAYYVL